MQLIQLQIEKAYTLQIQESQNFSVAADFLLGTTDSENIAYLDFLQLTYNSFPTTQQMQILNI